MAKGTYYFTKDFMWGTATAAHQVEGHNTNNTWFAWEQEEGRILNRDRSGLACDWWGGRWREDFDRAQASAQNAHRLSIEWSRIQPAPDRWDENALDRYREMLIGLQDRKMMPMVTLHHFSEPLWVAEMGGWENEGIIELFTKLVEKTVAALKPYCNLWVTINEPNVFAFSAYIDGVFPPGKQDIKTALRVLRHMVLAHARAYHVIHELQPEARVGTAINYRGFKPASQLPWDRWMTKLHHHLFNDVFIQTLQTGVFKALGKKQKLDRVSGTQDFLGLNYYTCEHVRFNPFAPDQFFARRFFRQGSLLSETGFIAHDPQGLIECVKWGHQFGVPMIITENGVEDREDVLRPRYLVEHLHALWRVINDNYPVEGYFYWTLVDNFEWERGWSQRFGLWELDQETQVRVRRPSAELYEEICRINGISSEVTARYAPEAMQRLFP
ncbi:MAG TPA: family 1 glycosylhydrolase [Brevefilum sp.]|nr:family 1 glycosylhydrolase [Brevefilum sp.]HOR20171.1 family 1 glycosylhydrolase [Brevefilum sp.]HPL70328.1 family 1 glycosylhydrolase [Brevefilum sp.]